MVQFTAGVLQAGLNVFGFKVGQFLENLLRSQTVCQQVEDVSHPNAHAPDAGSSSALLGVNCYTTHAGSIRHCGGVCTLKFSRKGTL
jgi:hypothetical protein